MSFTYSRPPTVSAGDLWTAGDQNTYLRGNMEAMVPALFTDKHQLYYATAADAGQVLSWPEASYKYGILRVNNPATSLVASGPTCYHVDVAEGWVPRSISASNSATIAWQTEQVNSDDVNRIGTQLFFLYEGYYIGDFWMKMTTRDQTIEVIKNSTTLVSRTFDNLSRINARFWFERGTGSTAIKVRVTNNGGGSMTIYDASISIWRLGR